jgi:hypothetical protein
MTRSAFPGRTSPIARFPHGSRPGAATRSVAR